MVSNAPKALANSFARLARAGNDWMTRRCAAGLHACLGAKSNDTFGILMYHRVAARTPARPFPTWNVTPEQLRKQLSGLLALGFQAWPLRKLIDAVRVGDQIPAGVFAVTFDDGYANNLYHALPILHELNVPATLFLATKFLDSNHPFHFDDWSMTGSPEVPEISWRPLTTSECLEIRDSQLLELGAHTHSHQRFLGNRERFREDLAMCVAVMRERFGIERPTFSFPFGESSPEFIAAANQVGVECWLSTESQAVRWDDSTLHWGRITAEQEDSARVLAAKLTGWHSAIVATRQRLTPTIIAKVCQTRSSRKSHGISSLSSRGAA